jgi:hypothetical protein
VALLGLGGCDSIDPPPPAPTCDQACQDGAAMRATREMMKLLYNLTVQGEPVGPQDHTRPCLFGGTARVFGQASSNAELGTTKVDLTYEFNGCGYLQKDDEAPENYNVTLTGVITQKGTFAAVTGGTTAVEIASEKITLEGTVHDPPIAYSARDCGLVLSQSGNSISGTICERVAGFSF